MENKVTEELKRCKEICVYGDSTLNDKTRTAGYTKEALFIYTDVDKLIGSKSIRCGRFGTSSTSVATSEQAIKQISLYFDKMDGNDFKCLIESINKKDGEKIVEACNLYYKMKKKVLDQQKRLLLDGIKL